MLKLNLQIQWIRLCYHTKPTKNHSIHLVLQNQEGEQLIFERKIIEKEQDFYFLDSLLPFTLHMIVGKNKPILCPFQLSLVSKLTPPVTRIVTLKHADIFNHYLQHELFAQIEPLQQTFTFQEGELVYQIVFGQSQTVKDVTEVEDLHKRLKKTQSMISEIQIKVSELTTQQPINIKESKLQEIVELQDLHLTQPAAQMVKVEIKPSKRLKSYHSMSEMTISQIAKSLETQQTKRYVEVQKETQLYETKKWYLKFAQHQDPHHAHHDQHSGWSLKVKLLVILLAFGAIMLTYLVITAPDQEHHTIRPRRKRRVSKKAVQQPIEHR